MGNIDITSFNAAKACAAGHEFELKNFDGSGTGIHLMVQGRHSDEVTKWIGEINRKAMTESQMAARRGKIPEPKTLEQITAQNVEGAVVRTIGWRGPKQDFDRDLLRAALKVNPHWVEQITEEAENLGNFMKATSSSSSSTLATSSD